MPTYTPITWDATGTRYFETGVDHGVLFVQKSDGSYDAGVPWNGLISVTASPDGAEPTDLWADNMKYATLRSAETFGATIEAYTYPDEFMQCDGSATVDNLSGVYIGQQTRKAFGFCYRTKIGSDTDTDASKYKLHIIYNATASPSERAYETINDSPDAITFSWEITTTPVNVTGYKPTSELVINVDELPAGKKAILENMLYGTNSAASELPSPDELISRLTGSSTTT